MFHNTPNLFSDLDNNNVSKKNVDEINDNEKTKAELISKKENITNKVKNILEKYPLSRDDDYYLVWMYWTDCGKNKQILLDYQTFKNLDNWDSITRARRYLQEKNENLRGEMYSKRKKLEEINRDIYAEDKKRSQTKNDDIIN